LSPDRFAGKTRLDEGAATAALGRLAGPPGHSVSETASAIVRVALATMYTEFSAVLERRGIDPRDFTLVAFGGAGPVVACLLADEVNISRVLVPSTPGTLAALGARHADVAADFIRSVHWRLDEPIPPALSSAIGNLRSQALAWLEREAPATERTDMTWTADMRYVGQSHEIETPLLPEWVHDGNEHSLAYAFHSVHQRLFNHADVKAVPEMVNLRVRAVGVADGGRMSISASALPQVPLIPSPSPHAWGAGSEGRWDKTNCRSILLNGTWHEADIYQRDTLGAGRRIPGPAIVEQPDTTTVIPPGWMAFVDAFGNLILERNPSR
jgi:N-methylhydantoinase A